MSLAASALAVWTQHQVQAVGTEPLSLRLENAAVSYATYLGKTFWPVHLAVLYPYPDSIPLWQAGGAALALGAVSWAVIREMKKRRYLAVGWFSYSGERLMPVDWTAPSGNAGAGGPLHLYSLHWAGGDDQLGDDRSGRGVAAGPGGAGWGAWLAMGCCLAVTWSQVKYWRNSTTLNEHASKVTSGNYVALSNLGESLMDNGKLDEAVKRFQEVIRLKPNAPKPYNNLGKVYAVQEKLDDAMAMFSKAISLNPGQSEAHYNLGSACMHKGKTAEGIAEFKQRCV